MYINLYLLCENHGGGIYVPTYTLILVFEVGKSVGHHESDGHHLFEICLTEILTSSISSVDLGQETKA